jgi:hypothetical protein
MTTKPRQKTFESVLSDHQRRIRRLEAMPDGGGGAGAACQDIEPDHNRDLPIDLGNYIGDVGYGFASRINDQVVDTACMGNGYVESSSPAQDDVTVWTPWLGPTGAKFRLNVVTLMGPDCGRLHLYAQRMVDDTDDGEYQPEDDPIDIFGGDFADLYAGSTQRNIWNVSYDFEIGGAGCDTPFTAADFSGPTAILDGSPSVYRLWLVVASKNASSSGYAARIQSAWLKRCTDDEP